LHPEIQLAYRNDDDGPSAAQLATDGRVVEFDNPRDYYRQLGLCLTSGNGWAGIDVRLSYDDGPDQTLSRQEVPDWFTEIADGDSRYRLIDGLERCDPSGTGCHDGNAFAIFGVRSLPDETRRLARVRLARVDSQNASTVLNLFGATGLE
jgi:hypothetical protein